MINWGTKRETETQQVKHVTFDTTPNFCFKFQRSNFEMFSNMDWDLLSSYAGLLSLATASIYAGAFGSLPVRDPSFFRSLPQHPTPVIETPTKAARCFREVSTRRR